MTLRTVVATLLALGATAAFAGPSCSVPKEQWMKEVDAKQQIEAQGDQIKTLR